MQVLEKILTEIEIELNYYKNAASNGMKVCGKMLPSDYEDKGTAEGLQKAMKIIRSHMDDDGWMPAETPPEKNMRVQALIKHHKWIADYDSGWVSEEEKTVHPEWMEVCEAIYKKGKFTFRSMEDDEFAETAHISPKENIAEPVSEILMWRQIAFARDNWIPVEERLPEPGEIVLVQQIYSWEHFEEGAMVTVGRLRPVEDGRMPYWEFQYYRPDFLHGTIMDNGIICPGSEYVTHWQPLPAPYQPKEDKA